MNLQEAIKKKKEFEANLITKALEDDNFRKAFLEDPKKVLEQETGQKIPDGIEIKVIEEAPNSLTFVLPRKPAAAKASDELSDESLDKVAGGAAVSALAEVSVIVDAII